MSFFSDERASELRDLFFESAQELLQALNEEGLELEKRPGDAEIVRTIRRTVHTLKGDSAACGFTQLSDLAHELEDILTPEIALRANGAAQLVLSAADMFDSMLSAYRNDMQPPDDAPLREMITALLQQPSSARARAFEPKFAWSEYERLVIQQSAGEGRTYNVGVEIDPQCPMRTAAVQLVRNTLGECGVVLILHPEDSCNPEQVDCIEAVVASAHDQAWVARRCRIPSVVANVVVAPVETAVAPSQASDIPGARTPLVAEPAGVEETEPADAVAASSADAAPAAQPTLTRSEPPQPTPQQRAPAATPEESQPAAAPTHTVSENLLRVDAERIDAVLNLVGELIIGKSMLHQAISEFNKRFPKDALRNKFADTMAYQAQVLNELQRSVMKIRMVPVEQLFRRFPRTVRDVAKQRNKEVELVLSGQETDLDKSILDALAEPLTHLVRNAVDHGIESPQERVAAGKPAHGTVRLNAFHQGNQVVIEVSDDGRGIDRSKVVAKAIAVGLISREDAARMSDAEILQLVFEPGFSTAEEVTTVSGRGVGLDVVKTVLERMKGAVLIHSQLGQGTTFQLKVPLTLAIIKALLFHAGEKLYAVPLGTVLEITRANEGEIHRVDGHEVLRLRDEVLTLVRLSRLATGAARTAQRAFIIVISVAARKFGLIVDKLIGEEELVIKALDDHLVATDLISGASILGDGTVVLILNTTAVVEKLGRIRTAAVEKRLDAEAKAKTMAVNA